MPEALSPYEELLKGVGIPQFSVINGEAVNQAIPDLLNQLEKDLETIEHSLCNQAKLGIPPQWDEVLQPLQQIGERLRWSWGVVNHLLGVCNNPELREAHQKQQAAVVKFTSKISQSKPIYEALEALESQAAGLGKCQNRILQAELLAMRLRGVGLSVEDQPIFNQLSEELSALATSFSNNVLDATADWNYLITEEVQMAGCPQSLRQLLAYAAKQNDHPKACSETGPWLLGLDQPRYGPFMQFSESRQLREQLYKAFITRASLEPNNNQILVTK
ncbi:MAG: Oligopeptidase, partial [Cyanobacteriota bacterium]